MNIQDNEQLVTITTISEGDLESESPVPLVDLGQWYWVNGRYQGEPIRWLGCVVHIGSNYVYLDQPRVDIHEHGDYSRLIGLNSWCERVHFKNFYEKCEFEPNHEVALAEHVNKYAREGNRLMTEIKEVTARLGLKTDNLVQQKDATGTGLAVMSAAHDINDYKNALVKAKKEDLPVLFKCMKNAHAGVAQWLSAPAMTMRASMKEMEESIAVIDSRIFNVSLYAGLDESLVQCLEGEAAPIDAVLHVMQRKLYMDEECLLNYSAGGMEFKDIKAFDDWLCLPENRDRILPFPRTLVAMQVRRKNKDRSADNLSAHITLRLEQKDKFTYLYIRNGDQVWRLTEDSFEFDESIFPDRSEFDPSEPMMFRPSYRGDRIDFMTVLEFDQRRKEFAENEVKYKAWEDENPDKDRFYNPFRRMREDNQHLNSDDWVLFNDESVYFDDACKVIADKMEKYNRVSLIIQGLFDRSAAFAPHVPVKTWVPESFNRSIKLVYDSENVLYAGEKPDFEAYRALCNVSINEDSVLTGQDLYWMKKEAEKENERESRRYRFSKHSPPNYVLYMPEGNPGMGYIAKPFKVAKNSVTFRWMRGRLKESWRSSGDIPSTCTVPKSELFNISAYKQGDYKQFFNDPRTRQEYLKWAHLLLAAEDYLANKHLYENGELVRRYANRYWHGY